MVYSLGPCETLRLAFRFINHNIIEFLYIYLVVYLFYFDLTHLFIVLFIWSLVYFYMVIKLKFLLLIKYYL